MPEFFTVGWYVQDKGAIPDQQIAADLLADLLIIANQVWAEGFVILERPSPVDALSGIMFFGHVGNLSVPMRVGDFHGELVRDLSLAIPLGIARRRCSKLPHFFLAQ